MEVAIIAILMMNLEKELFLLNAIRHAMNDARFNRGDYFFKNNVCQLIAPIF